MNAPAAPEGFAARVRSALAWRWGSQLAAQAVTWTSTLIVVRLLDPADYGLFAMTQVVIVALNFMNGYGFATSLIQADDVSERRIAQVFGLLIVLNAALATAQIALAPVAADYYDQPAVADMLRVQALLFAATPFIALPSALLARRIEFRSQALANLAGAFGAGGTALALAWFGFGVWALVYAPIVGFGLRAVWLTVAARVWVRPVFDFRGAGEIVSFGGALTLCQLFWIAQSQSDILIAGRAFEPYDVGLYAEALFLTLIVTGRFLPPINEVAFPAYAELHKAGLPLARYFERTLRTVLLVVAPLYVGLSLTAHPAVLTLFGPKWEAMVPLVAGLALAMPAMALQIVCSPATNAMGRPRVYLMTSVAGAVLMPAAFLWGVSAGPMGLVHAWWIAAPLLLAATLALTLPMVGLSPISLARELAPIALACLALAVSVVLVDRLVTPWPAPARLLTLASTGALAYAATLWLGWPRLIRETWAMLRHRDIVASDRAAPDAPTLPRPPAPSA